MYRIAFYCPDRHIEYDGDTPYKVGVGGGVTSRVRMAKALANQGQDVIMVVNCTKRTIIEGVRYFPLNEIQSIECDILIINSSGGDYDLTPIMVLDVSSRLNILWASGIRPPKGTDLLSYDFVYAKSNYLRNIIENEWDLPHTKIFVAYNIFDDDLFVPVDASRLQRDPHRVIYAAHPAKGLDSAVRVLRKLRLRDSRYHLIVCGGPRLWGQEESLDLAEPGIRYLGLIGQYKLALELFMSSYSINLQAIREVFGMIITESMRAGCVVIASRVGAYPEIIRDGENGFLLTGDHQSEDVIQRAANIIWDLHQDFDKISLLRRNAQKVMWTSTLMARVWLDHWNWVLKGEVPKINTGFRRVSIRCTVCGEDPILFPDGYHCVSCGWYSPATNVQSLNGYQ